MAVRFRIVGTDMPGLRCGFDRGLAAERRNVHVGIQRGSAVVDLVAGDVELVIFEFDVEVRSGSFVGPFVHGRGGERFFYLSWGEVLDDDQFTMFRRAKLQLDSLDAAVLEGTTVEARLKMSDAGRPVCASVRPPAVVWRTTQSA